MRLDRFVTVVFLTCAIGALNGCSWPALKSRAHPAPVSATVVSRESESVADCLKTLADLLSAPPAQQAEIVSAARVAASVDARASARLKYALVLGLPGHSGSDADAGRTALVELLAVPDQLFPQEHALAATMLANLNARTASEIETMRQRDRSGRLDRERIAALNRRLQSAMDDNEQLRKDLADANAKLDAIATMERNMSDRRPVPNGAKP